jgi:hypothetical protein
MIRATTHAATTVSWMARNGLAAACAASWPGSSDGSTRRGKMPVTSADQSAAVTPSTP